METLKFLPLAVGFLVWGLEIEAHGDPIIDPNGYIAYCPCMGRFGNQADHFLGSLAFAHDLNRTLIVPPWVEYVPHHRNAIMVPYDTYFDVEALSKYHRVISMHVFMDKLAGQVWPKSKRKELCWSARRSFNAGDTTTGCHGKDGNPFGPFWDHSGVDFEGSEYFGHTVGSYYTDREPVRHKWNTLFPPDKYPVLAFVGAPAAFPVRKEHRHLQKYVKWSQDVADKASTFINTALPPGPYLGVHLRNDLDWPNVCKHIEESQQPRHLFASPQCLGYGMEYGQLTVEMCAPSEQTVIHQIISAVRKYNLASVFIASDRNAMISIVNKSLKQSGLEAIAVALEAKSPHVSLAILGRADHFIGNCVSSYTSFAVREREVNGLKSEFWAFPPKKPREEL